jgi:hypothetical protein
MPKPAHQLRKNLSIVSLQKLANENFDGLLGKYM